MFFSLYTKHTEDSVFNDFLKISVHFPKTSEDFPKLFRRPDERSRRFSGNFRTFRMCEDCQRLSRKTRRCFNNTPRNLSTNAISVKSLISSHVRISYRLYQFVTTRYTTDFYIIKKGNLCTVGKFCTQ